MEGTGKIENTLLLSIAGKAVFEFRIELDNDNLQKAVEDSFRRFEHIHELYKIRVYKTSESLTGDGESGEISFLTIRIEAQSFRVAALRMSWVFNYLMLLDYGSRTGQTFEIASDARSLRLLETGEVIPVKGLLRRPMPGFSPDDDS
ncbi:hypothetical protein [Leptolyngbya sp. 7M]|uniref:hypothetical protein n=1 Tax=Leptolyngbya sp. 7M TaxID=2812896 RepID=UPI001B8ADA68|nr:hypothetical protein [Leptolyngbya sp. 7M]QYO65295.1 hypothetical protein JVX88_00480 [Leptolyngbya sp. 7M]